jgi:hypothetical protein
MSTRYSLYRDVVVCVAYIDGDCGDCVTYIGTTSSPSLRYIVDYITSLLLYNCIITE